MKSKKCKIIVDSRLRFITRLSFAFILPFLGIMIYAYFFDNRIVGMLVYPVLFFFISFFTKNLCKSNLFVEVTQFGLIIYEEKTFFKKNKKLNFEWSEIESYLIRSDLYFELFRIDTFDKRSFYFFHNYYEKDDFDKFKLQFKKKVKLTENNVERKKTVYEKKSGVFLAVILAIIMIVLPIVLFIQKLEFNLGAIFVFYSGALFFVIQVYLKFKKR